MSPPAGSIPCCAAAAAVLALLGGCGGAADPRTAAVATVSPAPGAAHARAHGARTGARAALPGPALQAQAVGHYAQVGLPLYCGARKGRLVALTFDDGPGPYTPIALRELRRAGARATFFLVKKSIDRFPAMVARERPAGDFGDHTMTHPFLPGLQAGAAAAEIAGGRAAAEHASGTRVRVFRPPYGGRNAAVDREVSREGMAQILWDVDSVDSRVSPPASFHEIAATVKRHIRPGSIVLMHENRGQTIRALRSILPELRRRGLRSVTVPELLAADPPSRAQLMAGPAGCGSRLSRGAGG